SALDVDRGRQPRDGNAGLVRSRDLNVVVVVGAAHGDGVGRAIAGARRAIEIQVDRGNTGARQVIDVDRVGAAQAIEVDRLDAAQIHRDIAEVAEDPDPAAVG